MEEIMEAVAALQAGDRQKAREQLLKLWSRWNGRNAALERCTIAHFLADTEKEAPAELEWDLLALEAATGTRNAEDCEAVAPGLEGFLPSLHLNVGDAYRRVGNKTLARRHAELGLSHAHALGRDPYGDMIRAGLRRLLPRIDDEP